MNIAGKMVRCLESKDSGILELVMQGLIQSGGAIAGNPILMSDLNEDLTMDGRPSPLRIQKALQSADILLVKLSADNFCALRFCEIRHLLRLPNAVVVQSASEYFDKHSATPFFQSIFKLNQSGWEESIKTVIDDIHAHRETFLSPEKVYQIIDHYLGQARCFKWGQSNFRHGPPNRISMDQYRSFVRPADLQRIYDEYQSAKSGKRPMQIIMGDQYNFSHANAVGPHSTSTQATSDVKNVSELAVELVRLVQDLRKSEADCKSELVCNIAAAAEAAAAGKKDRAMTHLSAIATSDDVIEKNGKRLKAKDWVIDNASKIGVEVAIAAIKTALGISGGS